MGERPQRDATELLQLIAAGEADVEDQLLPILYDELHRLARRIMQDERGNHTLQPTALINEAYVRLVRGSTPEWEGRQHFVRVAARAMRQVLVDHARRRDAQKRGRGERGITLPDSIDLTVEDDGRLAELDDSLQRLGKLDPALAQIVELRFFGGLLEREIATVLGVSERTVERGWRTARAWLRHELGPSAS